MPSWPTRGGAKRRYNTSILVDRDGRIVGKYRKVHLPGHAEHEPWRPFQHLEKRYFDVGQSGLSGLARASAACSACASATIAAGPRPIA